MPLLASSEVLIYRAEERFDDKGLVDAKSREKVGELMISFAELIRRYPAN